MQSFQALSISISGNFSMVLVEVNIPVDSGWCVISGALTAPELGSCSPQIATLEADIISLTGTVDEKSCDDCYI